VELTFDLDIRRGISMLLGTIRSRRAGDVSRGRELKAEPETTLQRDKHDFDVDLSTTIPLCGV
jgi:hypothetical protein